MIAVMLSAYRPRRFGGVVDDPSRAKAVSAVVDRTDGAGKSGDKVKIFSGVEVPDYIFTA